MGQLEEIQTFIRVVESGGVGKAAEQINVAKSVVSKRLSDLEERLGVKLIQRTTRKSSLTELGRMYYERAVNLNESLMEMNAEVAQDEVQLSGLMRISVPLSFGLSHLTNVMDEFIQLHPGLELYMDFSDREIDLVEEGFDLAFRIGDLKDSRVQARRIVPINMNFCASPDYIKQHGEPKTPEDLKFHNVLRYGHAGLTSVFTLKNQSGKATQVHVAGTIAANNGDFLRDMAAANHGIVMLPNFISWPALKSGDLVPILSDYKLPLVYAYAVYPQNRHLPKKTRMLIDYLVERFSGDVYWDKW